MRIKHNVNVFVSDDAAGEQVLFGQTDTTQVLQTIDNMQRVCSGKFSIAASGTENLPLGDVGTVRGIWIRADLDFDAVFNGGSDTISFDAASASHKATCFMEATLTQVAITNPSSTAALTGSFCVWGDPSS